MNAPAQERTHGVPGRSTDALRHDRAWTVLLGASLCMFCGAPAVIYYPFGIFLTEVIADTHWSKPVLAAAIGTGALISSATVPLIGRLSDRFGVRVIAIVGGPAFALGLVLLGIASTSAKTFQLWTMLMWLLAFAGSPVSYAQALTGWFDKRRGMAISIMFCCGALGIAAWPAYAAYLIAHVGWRHAYVVMGMSAGLVILLSGLFLLRNPPAQAVAQRAAPPPGLPVRDAVRTARFWKTAVVFLILTAVLGGLAITLPVILRQHGAGPQVAAAVISVVGITMFLGRVLLGLVLDRWFAPHVTIGITIVPFIAVILLMASSNTAALFAAAAFLGFGLGSEYAVAAYIVSRQFGFRSYGAIYGLVTLATSVGAAVGPAAIGASLVTGVGAQAVYPTALALLVLAIVILSTFRRSDLPFVSAPIS